MERRPHVVSRPLVEDVVVGEDYDRPPAVHRGLADGVRHVGCLGEVGVVEAHAVGRVAVLQLGAQDLGHEVLVLDAAGEVISNQSGFEVSSTCRRCRRRTSSRARHR